MKPTIQSEGRHLRDYWLVIVERKWLALSCFIIVVGLGALLTYLQDPVYQADAKVEIQVQAPNPLIDIQEGTQPIRSAFFKESYFQTQFEIIRSHDLLEAALRENGLEEMEPFASAEDPAGLLGAVLDLDIVPTTDVVKIGAQTKDPELSALLANSVAQTYEHWNVDRRLASILDIKKSLENRMQEEFESYTATSKKSIEDVTKDGALTPELQKSLARDSLNQMQEEIKSVESEIEKTDAVLLQARAVIDRPMAGLTISGLETSSALNDIVRQRGVLQDELKRQSATFKETHPDIVALRDQIRKSTLELVNTINAHLNTLREQRARLQRAYNKERRLLMETEKSYAPLQASEIEKETRGEFLETLAERYRELALLGSEGLLVNQAEIIERARPPARPIKPKVMMNMLVSLILGLMVGLGAAFFLDYLDVSIKTVEDLEKGLGRNVLATIPAERAKTKALVKESIQSLRTALIFADKAKPTNTVLFTSATPKEGKSTTLASLGRALAAGGERTVLLDCDFRLPTLSHIFQVPRERGIASYMLDDEDSWREHIRSLDENLDLFATGPLPPNPTDLLVSPRLTNLLTLLTREYKWVLVDSPPVTSMSDAILLADRVDGVVFVVRYDHADQRTVARALEALEAVGARVLGAVLNAVDTRKPGYRDYFYGRYAYYGEAKRREEEQREAKAAASG